MARLPALIDALSACDPRERKSLDHIARVIREAGHIPTTKRGGGAAEMHAREAANFLIAANGAEQPKDAAFAVDRFRTLVRFAPLNNTGSETLSKVYAAETFGAALEKLIEGTDELWLSLVRFVTEGHPNSSSEFNRYQIVSLTKPGGLELSNTKLTVSLARWVASISLETRRSDSDPNNYGKWQTEFEAKYIQDTSLISTGFYGPEQLDRRVKVSFGLPTIWSVWSCITEREADELPSV
jgi:hypothetical protein